MEVLPDHCVPWSLHARHNLPRGKLEALVYSLVFFFPHAKVYLISSLLCCVCFGFIFFFKFWSHKHLLGRSVHLPGYLFVVRLELAGSEETSIVQPEHHFSDEAQMAGVLENIIDKQ